MPTGSGVRASGHIAVRRREKIAPGRLVRPLRRARWYLDSPVLRADTVSLRVLAPGRPTVLAHLPGQSISGSI